MDEAAFQEWYRSWAQQLRLVPDPDDPEHYYDWRAAFKAGATPDSTGHWPSVYKRDGHPNLVVDGINTKTNERVSPMTSLPSTLFGPRDPTLAPQAPDPTTGLSFADFINMLQRLVPTQGSDLNYSGEPWMGAPKQPSKRTRDKPGARPGDYLGRTEGKNARPISTPPAGIPRTSMPPGSTTRLVTPFAPAAQMPNDPTWMGGVPPTVAGVPGEPPMIPTPSSPYIPPMNTPTPGQSGPFSLPNTATPEAAVAGLGGDPAHPGMAVGPGFPPAAAAPKMPGRGQTGPFHPGMGAAPAPVNAPRPGAPPAQPAGIERFFAPMLSDQELRRIFSEGPYDLRAK